MFIQPVAERRRRRSSVADGDHKRSICPSNKGVVVSPEGNVGMLASYPSPEGEGSGLNSLLEIHARSRRSASVASCPFILGLALPKRRAASPLWNDSNVVFILPQETAGSASPQRADASLDDHERRISHSLYGGLDGLDDNLMPRQGLMPRTVGKLARRRPGMLRCRDDLSASAVPPPFLQETTSSRQPSTCRRTTPSSSRTTGRRFSRRTSPTNPRPAPTTTWLSPPPRRRRGPRSRPARTTSGWSRGV